MLGIVYVGTCVCMCTCPHVLSIQRMDRQPGSPLSCEWLVLSASSFAVFQTVPGIHNYGTVAAFIVSARHIPTIKF